MDHQKLASTLRRLALQAGEAIMEVYGRGEVASCAKADDSPVTEADRRADDLITAGLRAAFPEAAIISEEAAASHAQRPERFFIVDPLDGTKEFLQKRGDFTVNIAWVEDGAPLRGVVYAPARGRLFYTLAGGEAAEELSGASGFDPEKPGELRLLRVRKPDRAALTAVASRNHRDQATDDYLAQHAVAECVSAGSSLKFCLVACGEADLYPRFGRTMEWDTAAADAVLRAAGGHVLRLPDLTPLRYGKLGWDNPGFLACAADFPLS